MPIATPTATPTVPPLAGPEEMARLLDRGGVLIYPTETLYALGCDARHAQAAARVAALKGRPQAKPFPLVLGSVDQLWDIAAPMDAGLLGDLERLAGRFWPGPLSVLVHTRPHLPALVRDATGLSSVRVSPHPTTRALCALVDGPLVATSANRSGLPATARPEDLDPALLAGADMALLEPPLPGGGAPSTLLRLTGGGRAEILRQGAVPRAALAACFELEPGPETGPGTARTGTGKKP